MEIQVNGGTIPDKVLLFWLFLCQPACVQVEWAREHMEKEICVNDVFQQNEMIDAIGVTKGHGFKGNNQSICT